MLLIICTYEHALLIVTFNTVYVFCRFNIGSRRKLVESLNKNHFKQIIPKTLILKFCYILLGKLIHSFVCLFIHLFVCFVYSFVLSFVYLFVRLSVRPCFFVFICLYIIHLSIYFLYIDLKKVFVGE